MQHSKCLNPRYKGKASPAGEHYLHHITATWLHRYSRAMPRQATHNSQHSHSDVHKPAFGSRPIAALRLMQSQFPKLQQSNSQSQQRWAT